MANPTLYKSESEDLELHVSICHERYIQLDNRLQNLEVEVKEVKKDVIDGQKSLKTTIITTSGSIIVAILTLLGTIFTLFADKIH